MSDENVSDGVGDDPRALSKEELDELQEINAKTIADLESEIKLLKRKLQQFGSGALPNRDFHVIQRPDGSNNLEEVEARLDREIEDHTARLKETMRLTGINIENIKRQVLEMDDNHCKKQFSLELQLLSRKVHLTCALTESLDDKDLQGGRVSWFEIKFEEDINEAVGEEVAKAAEELAIHSVFSLLKSYLLWQTKREEGVQKFTELYPNNVSSFMNKGGNQCLKITHPKPNHPVFTVEWGRKIVNARVAPDIKLEVKAPEELKAMDSKNILDSAPDMLRNMIASLGLEPAIDCLIQLVATDGKGMQQLQQQQQQQQEEQHGGETAGLEEELS